MNLGISKCSQLLALIALLPTIAFGVPRVNAESGPPRSVFAKWPESINAPVLKVSASRRADGRWQLNISAPGFVFSDICTSVAKPEAIGHAHLYDGDTKIAAAYTPTAVIGPFAPGTHHISVVLRARDHRTLLGKSGIIKAEIALKEPSQSSASIAAP